MKLTASDGESRVIGAGEIILVEDTTGKGHLSKAVETNREIMALLPKSVRNPRIEADDDF